tara:strand:+ start:271 stop:573 length:303 start_codon:yes stop_codon:yes gene_type:complete
MWFKEVESEDGTVTTVPTDLTDMRDRWQTVTRVGPMRVSTVFLGLDHWGMLYETMVFKGSGNSEYECERYKTRAEALEGHKSIVERWTDIHNAAVKPVEE